MPGFNEREIVNREYMNRGAAALGMGRNVDIPAELAKYPPKPGAEDGRAVDPLNPALKDIDQLEVSLLRKHPESF